MAQITITDKSSTFYGMTGEIIREYDAKVLVYINAGRMKDGIDWRGGTWLFERTQFGFEFEGVGFDHIDEFTR
jgi:hypothetical protein